MKIFTGKRLTAFELVILVLFTGVLLAAFIPALLSARIGTNEQEAQTFLRRIWRAEEYVQRKALLDRNNNSTGEYGSLKEIFKECPFPEKAASDEPESLAAGERRSIPQDARWGKEGEAIRYSGYFFCVFLPGPGGLPLRGKSGTAADPASAEKAWVGYAWPVSFGHSGKKAFFIHASGKFLETANEVKKYEGEYNPPRSLAAFEKGSRSLFDPLAVGGEGTDQQVWRESLH